MSVQDKIERILKEIHVLFAKSQPYGDSKEEIIVKKQDVFEILKELNLAVYEIMDEYEVSSQKRELAERRSQKRSEEIISKANKNVDDIYAASIIYTDDALSRVQHIMENANVSVKRIMRRMNKELEEQKEQVRQNQSELKEQLQDFADTKKYLKIIQEQNREREEQLREKVNEKKGKRIPNEGRSYSIQPEIKVNKAYFGQTGPEEELVEINLEESQDTADGNLSKVTGKEFAENLRHRARERVDIPEEETEEQAGEKVMPEMKPDIKVDLDAEYFKWKEQEKPDNPGEEDKEDTGKKDWKSLFGKGTRN